jgi:hypothetical protein
MAAATMLLTALLLHIGGMAADPLVHAHAAAPLAAAGHAGGDGDAGGDVEPPAAEDECSVCRTARSHAMSAPSPPVLPEGSVHTAPAAAMAQWPATTSSSTPARSRAPPSA